MRRMIASTLIALGFAIVAPMALADGPVHQTFSLSGTDAADAGDLCDFDYEQEFTVTVNRLRFFDENGALVRSLQTREEELLHRNADTGYELVEVIHYTVDVDLVSGEVRVSGNSWHLRTVDGRIVLVLSGLELIDLDSGELIRRTPKVGLGFENVICPALGGNPAA